jgi:hypothetical protein
MLLGLLNPFASNNTFLGRFAITFFILICCYGLFFNYILFGIGFPNKTNNSVPGGPKLMKLLAYIADLFLRQGHNLVFVIPPHFVWRSLHIGLSPKCKHGQDKALQPSHVAIGIDILRFGNPSPCLMQQLPLSHENPTVDTVGLCDHMHLPHHVHEQQVGDRLLW